MKEEGKMIKKNIIKKKKLYIDGEWRYKVEEKKIEVMKKEDEKNYDVI